MSPTSQRTRWVPVLLAALAALLVALMGGLATDIGGWYRALEKPPWQPPDWLFGPAWTLIYALAAMAGVSAWRGAADPAGRNRILLLFSLNAFLNVFWSLLFFRLQRPDWALVEVVFLWLSIVALIVGLRPLSRATTAYLLPYLAWVTFAGVLNAEVVRLNPGF
ncbi:tryptophan-rich sensory protein [Wenzhouxiangella sp. XN79A]|uniref:TspO/MBR family protein n=1 Tax=Wenzhouxiangella sp. XN79A TaxID=2724193 RepID=UPI00144A6B66|nr:TspO/MBR family protein [Wenzhouxiangella sp. XN79A]NKI34870.1 tryptophan-rich sensory protein [Wenzhouxiangella sp. XN79A]